MLQIFWFSSETSGVTALFVSPALPPSHEAPGPSVAPPNLPKGPSKRIAYSFGAQLLYLRLLYSHSDPLVTAFYTTRKKDRLSGATLSNYILSACRTISW